MRVVALETTLGKVELEMYVDHAPRTCANFATLASRCGESCVCVCAK